MVGRVEERKDNLYISKISPRFFFLFEKGWFGLDWTHGGSGEGDQFDWDKVSWIVDSKWDIGLDMQRVVWLGLSLLFTRL